MACAGVDLPPVDGSQQSTGEYSQHGGGADVITEGQERKVKVKLEVIYLPPGDLTPYERNARKHAPEDIEAIKKSILEDGFNDPSC